MTIRYQCMDKQLKSQCFQEKGLNEVYIAQIEDFFANLM
jgi:hypothetical protein